MVRTVSAGEIYSGCQKEMNGGEQGVYQFPFWLRVLSSAEIAQGPGSISEHAQLVVFAQEGQQGSQGALLQNVVSTLWAVAGDVPESPDGLLANIEHGR